MKLFKKTLLTASLAAIFMTGTANAQIIYGQPSMAQSLGQALGSGLSGNYSGSGYTTYYPAGSTAVSTTGGIGDAWGNFLSGRSSAWSANRNINGSNINNASTSNSTSGTSSSGQSSGQSQEDTMSSSSQSELQQLNAQISQLKAKQKQQQLDKNQGGQQQQQQPVQQTQAKSSYTTLDPNTQLSVTGVAHVLDGITMTVGNTLVILHGMIAPGNGQMCNGDGVQYDCGNKARENLAELVNNKKVACTGWGSEGECVKIDDQTNINNVILGQGIAQPE